MKQAKRLTAMLLCAALLVLAIPMATASAEDGYVVTFVPGEHATINVYYTQEYAKPDEVNVTTALSRDSESGDPDLSGNGQVNFTVVPEDGYEVTDVVIEGSYKNRKGPADTFKENTYRITKVASDLTITVMTAEKQEKEAYTATFVVEHATIDIYYQQTYTEDPDEVNVTTAAARSSETGEPDMTGNGQISFKVVPEEGYFIGDIAVSGLYKNFKLPAETGAENVYRITKVASDLTVTVTMKKNEPAELLRGDIDINEVLNINDAMQLYRYVSGQAAIPEGDEAIVDIDGKNGVNILDALKLYRVVSSATTWDDLGISATFPNPHIAIIDDPKPVEETI